MQAMNSFYDSPITTSNTTESGSWKERWEERLNNPIDNPRDMFEQAVYDHYLDLRAMEEWYSDYKK